MQRASDPATGEIETEVAGFVMLAKSSGETGLFCGSVGKLLVLRKKGFGSALVVKVEVKLRRLRGDGRGLLVSSTDSSLWGVKCDSGRGTRTCVIRLRLLIY